MNTTLKVKDNFYVYLSKLYFGSCHHPLFSFDNYIKKSRLKKWNVTKKSAEFYAYIRKNIFLFL